MALRYHCRNAYADALQSQNIITDYELFKAPFPDFDAVVVNYVVVISARD
jgi:hypothetical protein